MKYHCCLTCFLWLHLCTGHNTSVKMDHSSSAEVSVESKRAQMFINILFSKYGQNKSLSYEAFEHLVQNLGIGNVDIKDHDLTDHFDKNGAFKSLHVGHNHMVLTEDEHKINYSHSSENRVRRSFRVEDNLSEEEKNYTAKCLGPKAMLELYSIPPEQGITMTDFLYLCPALVLQIDQHICYHRHGCINGSGLYDPAGCDDEHHHEHTQSSSSSAGWKVPVKRWVYAVISVLAISLVGVLCVGIVPLMKKVLFVKLLHFLVALAVGSLTGDALLHLLPHALAPHDHQGHVEHLEGDIDIHSIAVWKGMATLTGLYLFFMAERVLSILTDWRDGRAKEKPNQTSECLEQAAAVTPAQQLLSGQRPSRLQRNSISYCLTQLSQADAADPEQNMRFTRNLTISEPCYEDDDELSAVTFESPKQKSHGAHNHNTQGAHNQNTQGALNQNTQGAHNQNMHGATNGKGREDKVQYEQYTSKDHTDRSKTEELTEDHDEHSMGGGHGHSHSVPKSMPAMACMVVMGDGLHNFSDGLAIGAAFATSVTAGLSTSVAVLCHELPHELGDFAVLLKAGLSTKKALFYNVVSSILCFCGMIIGVLVGNLDSISYWIFCGVAGMFIYISLADMLPQLADKETIAIKQKVRNLFLQVFGIATGVTIMLMIALYENNISISLSD